MPIKIRLQLLLFSVGDPANPFIRTHAHRPYCPFQTRAIRADYSLTLNNVFEDVFKAQRRPANRTRFLRKSDGFTLDRPTEPVEQFVFCSFNNHWVTADGTNVGAFGRSVTALDGSQNSVNGTTGANPSNRYGLGSGVFSVGIPRAIQFGLRLTF